MHSGGKSWIIIAAPPFRLSGWGTYEPIDYEPDSIDAGGLVHGHAAGVRVELEYGHIENESTGEKKEVANHVCILGQEASLITN